MPLMKHLSGMLLINVPINLADQINILIVIIPTDKWYTAQAY